MIRTETERGGRGEAELERDSCMYQHNSFGTHRESSIAELANKVQIKRIQIQMPSCGHARVGQGQGEGYGENTQMSLKATFLLTHTHAGRLSLGLMSSSSSWSWSCSALVLVLILVLVLVRLVFIFELYEKFVSAPRDLKWRNGTCKLQRNNNNKGHHVCVCVYVYMCVCVYVCVRAPPACRKVKSAKRKSTRRRASPLSPSPRMPSPCPLLLYPRIRVVSLWRVSCAPPVRISCSSRLPRTIF